MESGSGKSDFLTAHLRSPAYCPHDLWLVGASLGLQAAPFLPSLLNPKYLLGKQSGIHKSNKLLSIFESVMCPALPSSVTSRVTTDNTGTGQTSTSNLINGRTVRYNSEKKKKKKGEMIHQCLKRRGPVLISRQTAPPRVNAWGYHLRVFRGGCSGWDNQAIK